MVYTIMEHGSIVDSGGIGALLYSNIFRLDTASGRCWGSVSNTDGILSYIYCILDNCMCEHYTPVGAWLREVTAKFKPFPTYLFLSHGSEMGLCSSLPTFYFLDTHNTFMSI